MARDETEAAREVKGFVGALSRIWHLGPGACGTAQRVKPVKSQFIMHVPIASSMLCRHVGVGAHFRWRRAGRIGQQPTGTAQYRDKHLWGPPSNHAAATRHMLHWLHPCMRQPPTWPS